MIHVYNVCCIGMQASRGTTVKDSNGFRSESSWTPACGKVHEQYQQAKWSDDCLDALKQPGTFSTFSFLGRCCFPSTRPWRQKPWERRYLQQRSSFFSFGSVFDFEISESRKECIDAIDLENSEFPMKLKTRARHSMGSATTRPAGMAAADVEGASTWRMRLLISWISWISLSSISKSSQDATETAGFRGHTGKARSLATSSHIRIQANASEVWAWDIETGRRFTTRSDKEKHEETVYNEQWADSIWSPLVCD